MTTRTDNVPTHLRAATRRWYVAVLEDYDLESHHQRLLQAACEAWDQLQEAREVLRKEGTYVVGRYGPRAHPAVAVERDSRIAFARLPRELDLDSDRSRPTTAEEVAILRRRRFNKRRDRRRAHALVSAG